MKIHPSLRSGFTLVELLIVICIIGILAGLVSSAILKITRTAVEKRNISNADRFRAAIMEYWHDMGRWPVEDDVQPVLQKKKNAKIKDWQGTGSGENKEDGYAYSILFRGDRTKKEGDYGFNGEIVEKMVDALLPDNKTHKTFLDLHGFYCPAQDPVDKWPVTDVVDVFDAVNGNATDAGGNEISARMKPILVYMSRFIVCPQCGRFYSPSDGDQRFTSPGDDGPKVRFGCCYADDDGDGDPDCSFFKDNKFCYRFTKDEVAEKNLVRAALPYTVEIDIVNNYVAVRQDGFNCNKK